MYFFKIHRAYRDIVAICDSNLIGKRFEEGKFQLDVKEDFFKGEEVSEEKIIEIISDMSMEDATFNIIGRSSTNTALKTGLITEQGIKEISGIPFALVLI